MTFSQSAASNFVPFLARLVLGAVFIWAGYQKVFTYHDFTGEDAATLREMNISDAGSTNTMFNAAAFRHASFTQDPAGGGSGESIQDENDDVIEQIRRGGDALQDAGDDAIDQVQDDIEDATDDEPATVDVQEPGDATVAIHQRKLYRMASTVKPMAEDLGLGEYTGTLCWAAALTEFVGGVLIFIGLFARLWGLALAVVMLVAFYLTTWPSIANNGLIGHLENMQAASTGFLQMSLFVLAFGVFLTGAGALSLDRFLFKPHEADTLDDL